MHGVHFRGVHPDPSNPWTARHRHTTDAPSHCQPFSSSRRPCRTRHPRSVPAVQQHAGPADPFRPCAAPDMPAAAWVQQWSKTSTAPSSTVSTASSQRLAAADEEHHRAALGRDHLVIDHDGDVDAAEVQLTRLIRGAQSMKGLQGLVRQHQPLLNAKHITAVLTRLKVLSGGPSVSIGAERGAAGLVARRSRTGSGQRVLGMQEASVWLSDFLPSTQHLLPSFTMLEVAGSLHALARLEARPPLAWMEAVLEVAAPQLELASPAQLATCVWSLGRLGCDPGESWLEAACAASLTKMQLRPHHPGSRPHGPQQPASARTPATADPAQDQTGTEPPVPVAAPSALIIAPGIDATTSAAAATTTATEALQARPVWRPASATPDVPDATAEADVEGDDGLCHDRALVMLSWGLAKIQHNVTEEWTAAMLAEVQARWHRMDAWALSNLGWALTTLGVYPDRVWVEGFSAVCLRLLPSANSYSLSVVLWALVVWGARPGRQWFWTFFSCSSRILPTAEPQHIARYLWCCATLGLRPPAAWVRRVLQQTQVQAFDFDGQSVSNTLWALAKLGIRPPLDWLETLLVASYEQGLGSWGPQELSNTMWALGRMRHALEPAWADLFWSEAHRKLAKFSPQQQVNTLWGAVRTGQAPPAKCLTRLIKVSHTSLSDHSLLGAAMLLDCFGKLEHTPPADWMQRFFDTTLVKMQQVVEHSQPHPDHQTSSGHTATQQTPVQPSALAMALAAEDPSSRTSSHSSRGQQGLLCEKLLGALTSLRVQPPSDWGREYLALSLGALPRMRQGNLATVAYGVAVLGLRPGPEWLEALVLAADRHLGSAGGVRQVNRISLGKLLYAARHLPGPVVQEAYQRWRQTDWIAHALEVYDE